MAGVDKRLTDLTEIVSAPDDALLHVVLPDDISQNPAGSSYKIKKSNYGGLSDAPSDGETYGRKDGGWVTVSGEVLTTNTNITSSNLTTQDVAGFVDYINGLVSSFAVAANEIRTYTVTDTGQKFEILLHGRSFGGSEPDILTSDVLELERDIFTLFKYGFSQNTYAASNGVTGYIVLNADATVTGTSQFTTQAPGQNMTSTIKYRYITGVISAASAGSTSSVRSTAPFIFFGKPCVMEFFNTGEESVLIPDVRSFSGIKSSSAVIGNIEPSTLTSCIGLGNDSTDTNMQLMHNDIAGVCTKVDLGASFPAKYTVGQHSYRMLMYVESSTSVLCYIEDIVTGIYTNKRITSNLPGTTQQYAHTWRNNALTAQSCILSFYAYERKYL